MEKLNQPTANGFYETTTLCDHLSEATVIKHDKPN